MENISTSKSDDDYDILIHLTHIYTYNECQ